jgi:hypothetical protein
MNDEVVTPETPKPVAPQPVVVATPVVQPAVVAQPISQPDMRDVAAALLADVPEHLRGLIPDIDPTQQIVWYSTAKTTGVFSDGGPVVPITDGGVKPTVTPTEKNLNDLPIAARMASGYGQ